MKHFLLKSNTLKTAFGISAFAIIFLFCSIHNLRAQNIYRSIKVYPANALTPTLSRQADPVSTPYDERVGNENGGEETQSVMVAPSNNNCSTATQPANTLLPGANSKCGTLQGATVEAGEYTGCFAPAPAGTVWYSFIADQTTMWIAVEPQPDAFGNYTICPVSFGIAVYQSNTCFPNSPIACLNYFPGTISNVISKVSLTGLSIGAMYMVQVAISSVACTGNAWKPYCIKMGHPSTCTTCASNCGPMCITPGYTPACLLSIPCSNALVGLVTSTCPSYPLGPPMNENDIQTNCYSFTAVNDSMWLQQISYSFCNPNSYSFTYNLYNAGCGFISSGNVFSASQGLITGLVIGVTYKICYTLQAACSWDSIIWPFAYTTSSALPVEFVSFGGLSLSEKIKLYWTTASEENCKEYIIERTNNGMDFVNIAQVKGSGNSTSLLNYKTYDNAPSRGKNFYRIKQIDFNGNFSYSKMIAVNYAESGSDISIIPNPATDIASIRFNAAGNYPVSLKLIDMQGKVIVNKHFVSSEGINESLLDTKEIAKGIYSVQLILDDQNMISKLVKE